MRRCSLTRIAIAYGALALACAGCAGPAERILTFSGSAVGREGDVISRQLERFRERHPSIKVELRSTPDASDQRRQLYVQWLNAHAPDPDVLQLDVVWTAEFAAAGWIAGLDRYHPAVDQFVAAAVSANRWNGRLFALPWFVDVGMLYWRTDLVPHAPATLAELTAMAAAAQRQHGVPFGFVWQGARYEGLVTVFLEQLGAHGGQILDGAGRVAVDSEQAVATLTAMRDQIFVTGITPEAVLSWQEEQARLAFQNGQAVFMRNWPYAFTLLEAPDRSRVAGRFAVAAVPGAEGGSATAALGGSQLAVNAFSDQADDAYRLIEFLLQPEQMIERARIAGQFPPRTDLYQSDVLADLLDIPPAAALEIIRRATPRPVTPVYSQLSDILQVSLHRALTRQQEPRAALAEAAAAMRALLARVKLAAAAS